MRRWHLVALLLILAAGLSMGLVEYGKTVIATHLDYRVETTRPDMPLIYVSEHSGLIGRADDPDALIAVSVLRGCFARTGVPRLAGLLGGVIMPPLLVLVALGIAVRRRRVRIPLMWIAALFLFGMMLQVPVKYFSAANKADLDQQIAANAIYLTNIDTGWSCLGRKPCLVKRYYAFVSGVFPTEGVPPLLAIALGMVLPGLLMIGSVVVAFRPKPRRTTS